MKSKSKWDWALNEKDKHTSISSFKPVQLRDDHPKNAFWADQASVESIPKMMETATNQELKDALKDHVEEPMFRKSRLFSNWWPVDSK